MGRLHDMLLEGPGDSHFAEHDTSDEKPSNDSLDDQIDAFLIKYEKASTEASDDVVTGEDDESEKVSITFEEGRVPTLARAFNFLFEAVPGEEEDPKDPSDPMADPAGDLEGDVADEDENKKDDTTGSEDREEDEEADEFVPRIDIDTFTKKVYRLIQNHKSLLNPIPVIVNRAKNFLGETYDDEVIEEFIEILEDQYGISLDSLNKTVEDIPERPPAAGAGSSIG